MVGFESRRKLKKPQKKDREQTARSSESAQVAFVFGPPFSGVSSVLDVLKSASETPIEVVSYDPFYAKETLQKIAELRRLPPEKRPHTLLVDVMNGAVLPQDIQLFVDEGALFAARDGGCCVRIQAPKELCMERAARLGDEITERELVMWSREALNVEAKIRQHSLAYYMIANYDLAEAVRVLALRLGIKR